MGYFGDLVFRNADGSISHLDVLQAEAPRVKDDLSGLQQLLDTPEVVNDLFHGDLVRELTEKGMTLKDGQLYSFKTPLHLGGSYKVDNVECSDASVTLSILGQIHQQTKGLTAGTNITEVTMEEPSAGAASKGAGFKRMFRRGSK